MARLIVKDHPVLPGSREFAALEVEGTHVQAEAVDEDQRRSLAGQAVVTGRSNAGCQGTIAKRSCARRLVPYACRLDDLDVDIHAVVGMYGHGFVKRQSPEWFVREIGVRHPGPSND